MTGRMGLDLDDLKTACREIALWAMVEKQPVPAADIEALTDEYYTYAAERAESYQGQGEYAEVVNRAVWYLAHVHACPLMKTDVRWFSEMLDALLELAIPNTLVPEGKPRQFLQDVLEGIQSSLDPHHRKGSPKTVRRVL